MSRSTERAVWIMGTILIVSVVGGLCIDHGVRMATRKPDPTASMWMFIEERLYWPDGSAVFPALTETAPGEVTWSAGDEDIVVPHGARFIIDDPERTTDMADRMTDEEHNEWFDIFKRYDEIFDAECRKLGLPPVPNGWSSGRPDHYVLLKRIEQLEKRMEPFDGYMLGPDGTVTVIRTAPPVPPSMRPPAQPDEPQRMTDERLEELRAMIDHPAPVEQDRQGEFDFAAVVRRFAAGTQELIAEIDALRGELKRKEAIDPMVACYAAVRDIADRACRDVAAEMNPCAPLSREQWSEIIDRSLANHQKAHPDALSQEAERLAEQLRANGATSPSRTSASEFDEELQEISEELAAGEPLQDATETATEFGKQIRQLWEAIGHIHAGCYERHYGSCPEIKGE